MERLFLSSLEIAHVLFMDIVGYSRLPMGEQRERERHCCRCPIWVDGFDHKIRRSLDTGDWSTAKRKAAEIEATWEKGDLPASLEREPVSIQTGSEDFPGEFHPGATELWRRLWQERTKSR